VSATYTKNNPTLSEEIDQIFEKKEKVHNGGDSFRKASSVSIIEMGPVIPIYAVASVAVTSRSGRRCGAKGSLQMHTKGRVSGVAPPFLWCFGRNGAFAMSTT